jgi:hypothetical protein
MRLGDGRIRVCPLVTVTDEFGPNTVVRNRTSLLEVSVGGHVGIIAAETSIARLIPTVGLSLVRQREHDEFLGLGPIAGSQTFGELDLGAGIVGDHNATEYLRER